MVAANAMSPESRFHVIGDEPAGEDLLGYSPYVNSLFEVLKNPSLDTPFVVGVFGPWGTGKSTFMDLLDTRLTEEGFATLPFRPWQFEEKEHVWKALLLSVLSYLQGQKTAAEQDRDRLKSLLKNVAKLAIDKSIQAVTGDKLSLNDFVEVYAEAAEQNARFINTFRREFEEIKTNILSRDENPSGRLIVFVDDLDRCTPENCVMVLEAIKLFFDATECIFVIGIDREVVQKGIEYKYRQKSDISGQEYLEKIVQLPFTLPPVADESFKQFANTITKGFNFEANTITLLVEASDKNPRRLKRMANCLSLVDTVSRELAANPDVSHINTDIDRNQLALTLVIQIRFPVCHQWLSENPTVLMGMQSGELSSDSEEQLKLHLTRAYGPVYAAYALERFKHFVKEVMDTGSIPLFSSIEAVQATFQITGLVNEPRGVRPRKTSTAYDCKYPGSEPQGEKREEIPPEDITAKEVERGDPVGEEQNQVMAGWENLTGRSALGLLLRNSNTHVENAMDLDRRASFLSNYYEREREEPSANAFDASRNLARLRSVNRDAIASQLTAARQYLFMLVPTLFIVIIASGLAIEWWLLGGRDIPGNITDLAIYHFNRAYLVYLAIFIVIVLLSFLRSLNLRAAIVRIRLKQDPASG